MSLPRFRWAHSIKKMNLKSSIEILALRLGRRGHASQRPILCTSIALNISPASGPLLACISSRKERREEGSGGADRKHRESPSRLLLLGEKRREEARRTEP